MKKSQLSKLALTACIACVLTAAGCTRHVLISRTADGGAASDGPGVREVAWYDLATEPPVEAVGEDAISRVGQDSGPDIGPSAPDVEPAGGPETGPDVPHDPDLREAGGERGPDSGTEVAPEAGWEARPDVAPDLLSETILDGGPSGCIARPATAILADLKWASLPSTFLVHGDNVFVAFSTPGTSTIPPTNTIVAVSVSTGKTTAFSLGSSVPNRLAAGPDAIFYIQGQAAAEGGGWVFTYPDVARLDLATGQVSIVDSELVPGGYNISSLVGNSNHEVFWSMVGGPSYATSVIRRWDEATGAVETVLEVEQSAAILVDQDHLYWLGLSSSGRMALFSASTTGGAVSMIKEWSTSLADAPTLLAVDGQSLYYTHWSNTPPGIFSIPKAGGDSRAVAVEANPALIANQTIDDKHVYWSDYADPNNIWRVPKTGDGDIEKIVTGGSGYLTDLAVDSCNVYWIASDKNRLLVRSK
jgi:hypothetical protein